MWLTLYNISALLDEEQEMQIIHMARRANGLLSNERDDIHESYLL
jgi:hypothetical protein